MTQTLYAHTNIRKEKRKKNPQAGGCWWLTPVILATQEAEIKRIMAQSQLGQIVHETLS
jgi:hypothetical protein